MITSEYKNIFKHQDKHWWFLGMRDISLSLLDKYLPQKRGLKVLDAGCGTGAMLPSLQRYGDVTGVDLSDEALKLAKKRGKVVKSEITKLPFKSGSFDLVVCLDVLYHQWVEDDSRVIKEFNRVLKKGGLLLLREPAMNWLRGPEDVIDLTRYRFSKHEVEDLLRKGSFKILKISYANFFLFPVLVLVRIAETLKNPQQSKSEFYDLPGILNKGLLSILRLEASLLNILNFPFGSSVVCIAKKY